MASLGSSEKYGTFFRKSDLGQNLHQNYMKGADVEQANLKLPAFQLWSVITNNVVETKLSTLLSYLAVTIIQHVYVEEPGQSNFEHMLPCIFDQSYVFTIGRNISTCEFDSAATLSDAG
jgi:hypothetical protein